MRVVLTTFNAKYIHTSLALRWLYVANKDRFELSFSEYSIKEDVDRVGRLLLSAGCNVVGISVSIWNVGKSKELVLWLKQQAPELIVILGGPEVSYDPEFFLREWPVDYIISGEGEFVLGELLHALETGSSTQIDSVSSREGGISTVIARADIEKLALLPSPYQLERDKPDLSRRLVYVETSRGCPYQCRYCLSSLEKGVRYFPQTYTEDNLTYLIQQGARQLKFLDRTFNLNKKHTQHVFDFLIGAYRPGLICQFEIYADLLTDEIIDELNKRLPAHFFRFEIGIQSTYEPTNQAVHRKQDFPLLSRNISSLMSGGKIDLHLDLIAGLPHESFPRFVQSFNDVFRLGAKEVQLGFLKMLRGTSLRKEADRYGYQYNQEAPYEILCNRDLSQEELQGIHDAEHALEKFWNSGRFPKSMQLLFSRYYPERYFELFYEIGQYYRLNRLPHHAYLLEDLFRYLHQFLLQKGIDILHTLREDYYANYRFRPPGFWEDTPGKEQRKKLLRRIGEDKLFLHQHDLTTRQIEKHTVIDLVSEDTYLLTVFLQEKGRKQIEYTFVIN